MKYFLPLFAPFLLSVCVFSNSGCSKVKPKPVSQPVESLPGCPLPVEIKDAIATERGLFRSRTRGLYNQRKFADLEAIADDLRASKAQFGNGGWKLVPFYNCLECGDDEPESMWELHEQIHKDWIAAYPESITARVAQADFLVSYAWHARGSGYANTVTPKGWQLFGDRLAAALKVLDEAATLQTKCPMWWRVRMTVALGQGWDHPDYNKLFEEAKAFAPDFWGYDTARAYYLLPRWYGYPGEWEYVADADAKRPDGLGWEGYARVVIAQIRFYDNVFGESKASWPHARMGCELLRQKYPNSLEILSAFCDLACLAGDRDLAKSLFQEINGRMDLSIWHSREAFIRSQNWAYGGK